MDEVVGPETSDGLHQPNAVTYMQRFLSSAAQMDTAGIEESLDGGFALGSFEHVVDSWLFPTLEALGEGWARGEIDVAGEHAASHAVHRRLSAAFDAAGSRSRGPAVVVGLPSGSQHDLGALAFATAIRRRGMDVLYLGANVPVSSWEAAVRSRDARAAVLSVVTPEDRPAAVAVAERLLSQAPAPMVCAGGASAANLADGVQTLASSIGAAAQELDELVHANRRLVHPAAGRTGPPRRAIAAAAAMPRPEPTPVTIPVSSGSASGRGSPCSHVMWRSRSRSSVSRGHRPLQDGVKRAGQQAGHAFTFKVDEDGAGGAAPRGESILNAAGVALVAGDVKRLTRARRTAPAWSPGAEPASPAHGCGRS